MFYVYLCIQARQQVLKLHYTMLFFILQMKFFRHFKKRKYLHKKHKGTWIAFGLNMTIRSQLNCIKTRNFLFRYL